MNYLNGEKFNLVPEGLKTSEHKPRILVLYGSLRERSFSRAAVRESWAVAGATKANTPTTHNTARNAVPKAATLVVRINIFTFSTALLYY